MRKIDILLSIIIGEAVALVFLGISGFLKLPDFVSGWAKWFPFILPVISLLSTYIANLFGKKIPVLFQLSKFVLVGALNTFVDLGVLNLLMFFSGVSVGLLYSVFKAFSFFCSVVNSYFWNKFWTYEKKDTAVGVKEFAKFALVAGTGFVINVSIASLIVNLVGPQFGISAKLWANIGAIIATICVFMWNFLGYKLIVFKK